MTSEALATSYLLAILLGQTPAAANDNVRRVPGWRADHLRATHGDAPPPPAATMFGDAVKPRPAGGGAGR
jgi:hypothetical protein